MKRNSLYCIICLVTFMCSEHLFGQKPKQLPNIIVIFMDDMGYGDVGSYGATGYTTPNIDQMAKEGMRFTDFYAAQPICTVSRGALLTGCYPNRIGLKGALTPGSKVGLNSNEVTIPELLKTKNYTTAIVGKWHLGDAQQFLPLQHGFDQYFGLPYSNDMWNKTDLGEPVVDSNRGRARNPPLPLMEGNKIIRTIDNMEDMSMLTTWYTERAVRFISENKGKPFFLYLAHTMPHIPLAVSNKFKGKSERGMYGDVMMEIDWSVGEILRTLKKEGIDRNTLVVFTSDNGPRLMYGNHAGSAGGLREGKTTTWEGGVREDCIVRWPDVVPSGTVNNALSSTIDLLPTFAYITGAALPDHKIDGVNIIELFKGNKKAQPRTEFLYYFNNNDLEAVRKNNWKLVFPHNYNTVIVPGKDGRVGKGQKVSTGLALYDLTKDPAEKNDLSKQYPDVVEELTQVANKAREDLGDDLTGKKGANRREPGIRN
ncbi:MAG TPA: sulfatase [Chitinophagaceae bacterium]